MGLLMGTNDLYAQPMPSVSPSRSCRRSFSVAPILKSMKSDTRARRYVICTRASTILLFDALRLHPHDRTVLGDTMMQNTDTQGLQSKAEARLASLKEEKLVTRIAVLSTSLGQGKITRRLMIGMSIETHKTSPDFDQKKCNQAKSRIMQALDDIDCDVFIEMDR